MTEPIELPPLPKPLTNSRYWDANLPADEAVEYAARREREDQLREALRERAEFEQAALDAMANVDRLTERVQELEQSESEARTRWNQAQAEIDAYKAELGDALTVPPR